MCRQPGAGPFQLNGKPNSLCSIDLYEHNSVLNNSPIYSGRRIPL